MAGLFDGLDMESIMQMINPIGSAQAATAAQPTSGMGGLTPQAIINSESARNPINSNAPFPVVPPAGQPYDPAPLATRGVTPIPITPDSVAAPTAPVMTPEAPAAAAPTLDDLAVENAVSPNSVGAALTGGGTSGATDISAQSRGERRPNLAEVLKGTAMPKQPEGQKISTPAAPRPTGTIKSGELIALLTALNSGGGGKVLGR